METSALLQLPRSGATKHRNNYNCSFALAKHETRKLCLAK